MLIKITLSGPLVGFPSCLDLGESPCGLIGNHNPSPSIIIEGEGFPVYNPSSPSQLIATSLPFRDKSLQGREVGLYPLLPLPDYSLPLLYLSEINLYEVEERQSKSPLRLILQTNLKGLSITPLSLLPPPPPLSFLLLFFIDHPRSNEKYKDHASDTSFLTVLRIILNLSFLSFRFIIRIILCLPIPTTSLPNPIFHSFFSKNTIFLTFFNFYFYFISFYTFFLT